MAAEVADGAVPVAAPPTLLCVAVTMGEALDGEPVRVPAVDAPWDPRRDSGVNATITFNRRNTIFSLLDEGGVAVVGSKEAAVVVVLAVDLTTAATNAYAWTITIRVTEAIPTNLTPTTIITATTIKVITMNPATSRPTAAVGLLAAGIVSVVEGVSRDAVVHPPSRGPTRANTAATKPHKRRSGTPRRWCKPPLLDVPTVTVDADAAGDITPVASTCKKYSHKIHGSARRMAMVPMLTRARNRSPNAGTRPTIRGCCFV
jgi:hypothetical protein